MNLLEIFEKFPTEKNCIEHLEKIKWKDKPICPYCLSFKNTKVKEELRHHCNKCNTSFSVSIGTIFHQTHLPLQKWFLAIYLIFNAKKDISSRQLARDLKVNKDTAWSMQIKIRRALVDTPELMQGVVEMGNIYAGDKKKSKKDDNDLENDGLKRHGHEIGKIPVAEIVQG